MKIPAFLKNPTVITWIVVGGLGLYAYSRFRRATALPDQGDIAKDDLRKLGQTPSYSDTSYVGFADKINSAGVTGFGTDENAIYDVFQQMKNDADVLKLIAAFGNRRIEFSLAWAGLSGWLRSELDAREIAKINAILAGKGITYRF
jgi:hypothetical protein